MLRAAKLKHSSLCYTKIQHSQPRLAAAGIRAPNRLPCQLRRAGARSGNGGARKSPRTTKLYDRTKERLTQDELERIRL